jgi:hypothetical protein
MIAPRQNSVPLIRVWVRYRRGLGHGHSRSWRKHDRSAVDYDTVGTGFAGGCDYPGERVLALSTWHCHRLRRRWPQWHSKGRGVGAGADRNVSGEDGRPVVAADTIVYGGHVAFAPIKRSSCGLLALANVSSPFYKIPPSRCKHREHHPAPNTQVPPGPLIKQRRYILHVLAVLRYRYAHPELGDLRNGALSMGYANEPCKPAHCAGCGAVIACGSWCIDVYAGRGGAKGHPSGKRKLVCGAQNRYCGGPGRPLTYHCSRACEWRHRRARNRVKQLICVVCNQPFLSTRRDAKYCSDAHRQEAYRERA